MNNNYLIALKILNKNHIICCGRNEVIQLNNQMYVYSRDLSDIFRLFYIDNLKWWIYQQKLDFGYFEFDYKRYQQKSFLYKLFAWWHKKNIGIKFEIECPNCNKRHIDKGIWKYRPHRKHLCKYCGNIWKLADFNTIGV